MRIGNLDVIPLPGLSWLSEISLVQQILPHLGLPPLSNVNDAMQRAQAGQPAFVVRLENLDAGTVETAGQMAEDVVRLLVDLLAVHRDGSGAMFAIILIDHSLGRVHHRFLTPMYTGNLLGGPISGESPQLIANQLKQAKATPLSIFHLSLYRQALSESGLDSGYFRFWNFLETVANGRGVTGRKLHDWSGNVVQTYGRLRERTDEVKVFELLRIVFYEFGQLREDFFQSGTQWNKLSDLVPLWYGFRNATVHYGGFDPIRPQGYSQYSICEEAHKEICSRHGTRTRGLDEYFRALRESAEIVMRWELGERLPPLPGLVTRGDP